MIASNTKGLALLLAKLVDAGMGGRADMPCSPPSTDVAVGSRLRFAVVADRRSVYVLQSTTDREYSLVPRRWSTKSTCG